MHILKEHSQNMINIYINTDLLTIVRILKRIYRADNF